MELHGTGSANLHVMGAMVLPGTYCERGMLHPFLECNNTPTWLRAPIDGMDADGYVYLPQALVLGPASDCDHIEANRV